MKNGAVTAAATTDLMAKERIIFISWHLSLSKANATARIIPFASGASKPLNIGQMLLFNIFLYMVMYVIKKFKNVVIVQAAAIASTDPI